jgi:hypothetical protein
VGGAGPTPVNNGIVAEPDAWGDDFLLRSAPQGREQGADVDASGRHRDYWAMRHRHPNKHIDEAVRYAESLGSRCLKGMLGDISGVRSGAGKVAGLPCIRRQEPQSIMPAGFER